MKAFIQKLISRWKTKKKNVEPSMQSHVLALPPEVQALLTATSFGMHINDAALENILKTYTKHQRKTVEATLQAIAKY